MAGVLLSDAHRTEVGPGPGLAGAPPRRGRAHGRRWAIGVVLVVLFLSVLGIVVGNEVQANDRYATTHKILVGTRYGIALVDGSLTGALRQLGATNGEVGAATTALTQDAAELKAAQTSLSNARSTAAGQANEIGALDGCLGGVEKAVNALSVNDQGSAITALRTVLPSCQQATGPVG